MPVEKAPIPIRLFWKAHKWVYKTSGGRIGRTMGTAQNLLLTTTGRKSGKPREIVIYFFEIEGKTVIIGSNLGRKHHPAWYLNLRANPQVTVQIGTEIKPMIAREAEGEERQRLWDAVVEIESTYDEYKALSGRHIPVIVFDNIPAD